MPKRAWGSSFGMEPAVHHSSPDGFLDQHEPKMLGHRGHAGIPGACITQVDGFLVTRSKRGQPRGRHVGNFDKLQASSCLCHMALASVHGHVNKSRGEAGYAQRIRSAYITQSQWQNLVTRISHTRDEGHVERWRSCSHHSESMASCVQVPQLG